MRIIFKTIINKTRGTGHFYRCLNFAKFLKKNHKNQVIFFTNKLNNRFKNNIKKNLFKHETTSSDQNFLKKIQKIKFTKYIIIDDPDFSLKFEKKLNKLRYKICVIEDICKKHSADIIINQNYVNKKKLIFLNKYTKKFFIGPEYVLNLNKIKKSKSQSKRNKKVLIYMGGTDSKNYTQKILKSLNYPEFEDYKFVVIKGIINDKIKENTLLAKNVKLKNHQDNFEKYLFNFDFCITGGGSSIWQMLYANLKILVINQNLNQSYNSLVLRKKNFIKHFNNRMTEKNLYLFFKKYINNKPLNLNKLNFLNHGISRIAKKINEN